MKAKTLQVLFGATALLATQDTMAQTPFNTISGTIWKEQGALNHVRNAGEPGVAGIMVSLIDANSGVTVANALSDTTGAYTISNYQGVGDYVLQFDYASVGYNLADKRVGADNTINSAADPLTAQTDVFTIASAAALTTYHLGVSAKQNTITYSTVKPFTLTDWNQNFVLPKSDLALGVLTKATIYVNNTEWHPYFGVENTSGTPVSTSPSAGIQFSVTPPVGAAINVTNSIPHLNTALGAYDGTTDYGGVSGKTWSNEFASVIAPPRVIAVAGQLNTFRGTGSVTFPATALGTVTLAGGGNLLSQISTRIGASVTIVYEYAGGILPVTLTSFNAHASGNNVALNWITTSETNNNHFDIEKSLDGKIFSPIASIGTLAKGGNSDGQLAYTFMDRGVASGNIYYRLKQVDNDGQYVYSGVRSVVIGQEAKVMVYPNPAKDMLYINASQPSLIRVFDVQGRMISVSESRTSGILQLDVSQYQPGNYILSVEANGNTYSKQFSVAH